jgi:hypothetical protein
MSKNRRQHPKRKAFVVSTKKLGETVFKVVNDGGLYGVQVWENGTHEATIGGWPTLQRASAELKKHIEMLRLPQ